MTFTFCCTSHPPWDNAYQNGWSLARYFDATSLQLTNNSPLLTHLTFVCQDFLGNTLVILNTRDEWQEQSLNPKLYKKLGLLTRISLASKLYLLFIYNTQNGISRWLFYFPLFTSKILLDFLARSWCWELSRYIRVYWEDKSSTQRKWLLLLLESPMFFSLCSEEWSLLEWYLLVMESLGSLWYVYISIYHKISKLKYQKTVTELLNCRLSYQSSYQPAKLHLARQKNVPLH